MGLWDTLLIAAADWFGKHSMPTIAGFIAGLVAAVVLVQRHVRDKHKDKPDD